MRMRKMPPPTPPEALMPSDYLDADTALKVAVRDTSHAREFSFSVIASFSLLSAAPKTS